MNSVRGRRSCEHLREPTRQSWTGCRFIITAFDRTKHLDGKTPSEAAGIEVQGENKWITLIQNVSQNVKAVRKEPELVSDAEKKKTPL